MKVNVLEFNRYKCGIIKVHEYRKHKEKYLLNPKYKFHQAMCDKPTIMFPIIYKKYYKIEK